MSNQEAVKKYQTKRDAIMLRPPISAGAEIRAVANKAGQSVNAYILEAVQQRMEAEGKRGEDGNLL